MFQKFIFVLGICGIWSYHQVLRPDMVIKSDGIRAKNDLRQGIDNLPAQKSNKKVFKVAKKSTLEKHDKLEAWQEDLLKTLIHQSKTEIKFTKKLGMSIGDLTPCCGSDSSETVANAALQTISDQLLQPQASGTHQKTRREIDIFVNAQSLNDPSFETLQGKRNTPWLFPNGEYGDAKEQTVRGIVKPAQLLPTNSLQAQGRPVSSSILARFNKMFTWLGEPALLTMGIVGNALLVTVFLVTPLRLRVISQTIAAAAICDLFYTTGCLFLHLASKGVRVLALPGACQLLTFTLIMSQIMSIWCLFFSHLSRLNVHTKTGNEGRRRRVCKAKFTVIILAFLIAAVSVHYLWSMDKLTVAGHVFCAPMLEMISAHIVLRKVELVIGIVLPLILIAGIDLLLAVKLIVHMLVARCDKLEEEDDIGYKGSSTFGAHKIVKMPLNRQILKQVEDVIPTPNDQAVDFHSNNVTTMNRRTSESSTDSHKALPCEIHRHTVHIEVTEEKTTDEIDLFIKDEVKSCSLSTTLESQHQSQESFYYFSSKVGDDLELLSKKVNEIEKNDNNVKCHENKDFFHNEIDYKAPKLASDIVNSEPSPRALKLEPIFESHVDDEGIKTVIDTDDIELSKGGESSHFGLNTPAANSTSYSDNSLVVSQPGPVSSLSHGDTAYESCVQKEKHSCENSGSSQNKKRRLSNFKAVISSIAVIKTKTLRAKKVGFLVEVAGERTRSDDERRNKPRLGFFSHSDSGAASKSSNKYASCASYLSIDSSVSGSYRQPEDHEFPDDSTSCTVMIFLMGLVLAVVILPGTSRHAMRLFDSPVSSPPSLGEIEMAKMDENLTKLVVVYKIFLCVMAMSSFRYALVWLVREWLPRKLERVTAVCCRCKDKADSVTEV